jgi:hypothetical protein
LLHYLKMYNLYDNPFAHLDEVDYDQWRHPWSKSIIRQLSDRELMRMLDAIRNDPYIGATPGSSGLRLTGKGSSMKWIGGEVVMEDSLLG